MSDKKKKDEFVDDGRTYCNMNVEGLPWYTPEKPKDGGESINEIKLTKKERRAITKSYMLAFLPKLATIVIGFALALLLVFLWLN